MSIKNKKQNKKVQYVKFNMKLKLTIHKQLDSGMSA